MAQGEITPNTLRNCDTRNVRRLARFLKVEEDGVEIKFVIDRVITIINPHFWSPKGMYG